MTGSLDGSNSVCGSCTSDLDVGSPDDGLASKCCMTDPEFMSGTAPDIRSPDNDSPDSSDTEPVTSPDNNVPDNGFPEDGLAYGHCTTDIEFVSHFTRQWLTRRWLQTMVRPVEVV